MKSTLFSALLRDRFDRLLARCPDCHKVWKTGEPWEMMESHARKDALKRVLAPIAGLRKGEPEGIAQAIAAGAFNNAIGLVEEILTKDIEEFEKILKLKKYSAKV